MEKTYDEALAEIAERRTPSDFLDMLAQVAEQDEAAQAEARKARHRLNRIIAVGLARPDINNRRMAETTGIKERDLYKRKDRI